MYNFQDTETSEYKSFIKFVDIETNIPIPEKEIDLTSFPYGYPNNLGEFKSFQQKELLSKDECDFLIWLAESEETWLEDTIPFWVGRNLPFFDMLPKRKYAMPDTLNRCKDIHNRIQKFIKESFNEEIWVDQMGIVRWPPGSYQMPHKDDVDGLDRIAGCVVFLNDDYEGGEPFYPHYNQIVKPETGIIYAHSSNADHLHGVTQIKNKTRYTISTTWTRNKDKRQYVTHV